MKPPHPESEIRALTGIRGVAAVMVVLYHTFKDSTGLGPAHAIIVHGYIAVDLFFVLSGFVMALTYGPAFAGTFPGRAFAVFIGKRLGRVYPLYLFVTLAVAGLVSIGLIAGTPPTYGELASNLLMIQAWGIAASIGGPTWSISTEFAAYLAFPVLVAAILSGGRLRCWLAVCLAAIVLVILAGQSTAVLHQTNDGGLPSRSGPLDIFGSGTPFPLLRCLAGFVLGLASFRLLGQRSFQSVFAWRPSGDLAGLAVVALWAIDGSDVLLELAFVPLVMALAAGGSWLARATGSGLVYWLGEISYSIYLVHRPVENLMRHSLAAELNGHHIPHAYTVSGVVPLVATIAMAACTYYGIEKPARNLSRRAVRIKPRKSLLFLKKKKQKDFYS